MNYWLIIIPFISAFIGWFSNWAAFKILFHPRKPKKLLGISFQGIFPKKQKQFAAKLGKLLSAEFLPLFDMEQLMSEPEKLKRIMPMIEKHVDEFLRVKLSEEIPMLKMFVGEKTIESMKKVFMQEIGIFFPQVMKEFAVTLEKDLDFEQILVAKLTNLPSARIEEQLYTTMSKELRSTGRIGAVIGFIVGCVQLIIILVAT